MIDFEKAFAFTANEEGLVSNLKGDPGGKTCMGIASAYHPKEYAEIMEIPENQRPAYAKEFYRKEFWVGLGCDKMPWPLSACYFDTAVNCGPSRAARFAGAAKDYIGFLCQRARWQIYESKSAYTASLLNRQLRLFELSKSA